MSTEFYLKEKRTANDESNRIAFRFFGGNQRGLVVQLGFDEELLSHLRTVELVGENGQTITVGELFESAKTVEFKNGLDYSSAFSSIMCDVSE
jgi:hypothetical protein